MPEGPLSYGELAPPEQVAVNGMFVRAKRLLGFELVIGEHITVLASKLT